MFAATLVSCATPSPEPAAVDIGPAVASSSTSTTVPLVLSTPVPPTIDSDDFHLSENAIPLPQLVGLKESTARQWADDSGFSSVRLSTEMIPLALVASERIVLTVFDGVVTHAEAG